MDIRGRALIACKRLLHRQGGTILNIISPIWMLSTVIGVNKMAHDYILDYLYGEGTHASFILRLITWFVSAQMILHYIALCTVKSNYISTPENNIKREDHEKMYPHFNSAGLAYEQLGEKRSSLGTGNWSVITQYVGSEMTRTAFPYWSWKPCIVCSFYKPPRCYHCPICNVCVLKRDHHCFFAMQCVGLHNQRYFVVFNFWATLLTWFATPQLLYYTHVAVWPVMRWYEAFLPWTLISTLIGWCEGYTLAVMLTDYSMVFFILTTTFFLNDQLRCIDEGLTSFEREGREQTIETQCKSRFDRFACVFGRNQIWMNLLIPYHWASPPTDDGMTWESMKME